MFDIKPKLVSLVGQPANRREFLVTKNKESHTMDKIIEIIKSTESADEASLVESLKERGVEQDGIDAAVTLKRVLGAFADTLTEDDLMGIAKSVDFKVDVVEQPATTEPTKNGEAEMQKRDDDEMNKLREEVAQLKAERRLEDLRKMAADIKVGDQKEILETLRDIDNAGGDVTKAVALLKSASAAVEAVVGQEIGSSAATEMDEGYEAIQAEARKIASDKGVDYYEALSILEKTRPDFVQKNRS